MDYFSGAIELQVKYVKVVPSVDGTHVRHSLNEMMCKNVSVTLYKAVDGALR